MVKFFVLSLVSTVFCQEIAYDYEMENPIEIKAKGGK